MCKIVNFPRNCEMKTVATCSTTDGNGSYHGLASSFFEEMTRFRRQKHCRQRPDNPNGPSKFRKYCGYLPLLRLFTSVRSRLLFRGLRQQQLLCTRTVVFRIDDTLSTSKTSLKMTRQPKRSIEIPQFRFVYVYRIATDDPPAAPRLMAASGDRSSGT